MDHLVIFAPNWLGDAVMALPAIADVHRTSPSTALTVAARPAIAPLFRLVPHVHEVVVVERRAEKLLRDGGFDAALLLPNSFHAAVLAWRAAIPARWGYRADWRGWLLTRAVDPAPSGVHQVEYYQQLVRALGFPTGPPEPRLEASPMVRAAGTDALARVGWDRRTPLIALAPGAAYGGAKRWAAKSFAAVARELADGGVATVMIGSAADRPAANEVEAYMGAGGPTLNLVGATDLPTLAGVLLNCRALVTNDSGAMHVAAALGVRVIAVFGPTDEHATGPRGEAPGGRDHVVLTHPVWCRPCMLAECPLDHRCMRGVEAGAVLAEIRRAA